MKFSKLVSKWQGSLDWWISVEPSKTWFYKGRVEDMPFPLYLAIADCKVIWYGDYGYDDYTGLYSDDLKVSLGTNNGYNVDIKKYVWGQGEPFFLRDSYKYPYNGYRYSLRVKPAYFDTNATESDLDDLLAKKQVNINTSNYEYDTVTSGVRPAFNLNITNVLFASAVPTKNGTGYSIEDDAAVEDDMLVKIKS